MTFFMVYHGFQAKKFPPFFDVFPKPIGLLFCNFFNQRKGCNFRFLKKRINSESDLNVFLMTFLMIYSSF